MKSKIMTTCAVVIAFLFSTTSNAAPGERTPEQEFHDIYKTKPPKDLLDFYARTAGKGQITFRTMTYTVASFKDSIRMWKDLKRAKDQLQRTARDPAERAYYDTWWADTWFPIADDGAGDLICINLSGEGGYRFIYFENEGTDNPQKVANDLDGLLKMHGK